MKQKVIIPLEFTQNQFNNFLRLCGLILISDVSFTKDPKFPKEFVDIFREFLVEKEEIVHLNESFNVGRSVEPSEFMKAVWLFNRKRI